MRDGRRNRLGLATGTANPGENVGNTSTSGLGSLINMSDLYKNALQKNNLLSDLEGIYGTDLTEQELAAGIKPTAEAAGTPLHRIPGFEYSGAARDFGYLPSTYKLYLSGGFPEETIAADTAQIPGAVDTLIDTSGGGGDGGDNIAAQLGTVDTGTEQINMDTPLTSDPFLASGAAGGARLPTQVVTGAPEVFDIDETGDPALNMPVDDGMVAGPFDYIQQPAIDAERLAGYNTQDPTLGDRIKSAWTSGSNIATEFGQDIADKLNDLKDRGIDIGRMAGSAIMNLIQPGLGFIAQALPPYEPTFEERTLEEELGVTEQGKFSGDPNTSAFAELNAVSAFGNPVETAKNRIDERNETIKNNPNISEEFKKNTEKMEKEWDRVTNVLGDVTPDATDLDIATGNLTGDQTVAEQTYADIDREEGLETLGDIYSDIMETRDPGVDTPTDIVDTPTDIVDVQAVEENIKKAEAKALADQETKARAERVMQEQIAAAEAMEAARLAEIDRQNRTREAEQAAANRAAVARQAALQASRGPIGQGGGDGGVSTGAGRNPWGRAKGGLIRKPYGKGGIVDLL